MEILNEKNMTQYMLAKRTGMSPSSINSIIRRGNSPTVSVLKRICEGLGVTVGYFFKEKDICGDLEEDGYKNFYEEITLPSVIKEEECDFFKCRNREKCFEDIKKELFKEHP